MNFTARRSRWIAYERVLPAPRQVVCIAHSGGGASFFAGWQSKFGEDVQVLPVQLPGRENRVGEPLIPSCRVLAENLAYTLVHETGLVREFAIFGHSLGGMVGFELARVLANNYNRPANLCVVSSVGPTANHDGTLSRDLDDEAFLERVQAFGGIESDSPVLTQAEARVIYLRILRADFEAVENYVPTPLMYQIPVRTYLGAEDPVLSPSRMREWAAYTVGEFTQRIFVGDHFYLRDNWEEMAKDIRVFAFNLRSTNEY